MPFDYGFYVIKKNKENWKYDTKQVEIGKKLISKPRSWRPKTKERDKRPKARGL
jgi:hypothetical protein